MANFYYKAFSTVLIALVYYYSTQSSLYYNISVVVKNGENKVYQTWNFPTFGVSKEDGDSKIIRIVKSIPEDACQSLEKNLLPERMNLKGDAVDNRFEWVLLANKLSCDLEEKVENAQKAGFGHLLVYDGPGPEEINPVMFKDTTSKELKIGVSFISATDGNILKDNYTFKKIKYKVYLNRQKSFIEHVGNFIWMVMNRVYNDIAIFCRTFMDSISNISSFLISILQYFNFFGNYYKSAYFQKNYKVGVQVVLIVLLALVAFGFFAISSHRENVKYERIQEEARRRMRLQEERLREEYWRRRNEDEARRQGEEDRQREERARYYRDQRTVNEVKYSKILQIPPNSSVEEIKRAWNKLKVKLHPDRAQRGSAQETELTQAFQELHCGYKTLMRYRGQEI